MWQVGISGMGKNGFMNMTMQKEQDTKDIIRTCEQLIDAGIASDQALKTACEFCNVNFDSFLHSEKEKIRRKVEEVYKARNNVDNRKG